jgi:hypothetical protein
MEVRTLGDFCEANGVPRSQLPLVWQVYQELEAHRLAQLNQRINRVAAGAAGAALPLRDGGDEFGQMVARVPRDLYFHLLQQRNFGAEGFQSDEGVRDLLKAYPQCGVTTVTNKIQTGYTGYGGENRRTVKRYNLSEKGSL